MRSYRFRLYPVAEQERVLLAWLEFCRLLYNWALAERREHYRNTGHGLSYEDQANLLPAYKREHSEYLELHSQVLQNVLRRLDRAFVNFFEGRARYPRFKRYGEYGSITYPQAKAESIGRHSIILSKIGRVRMVKHRPVKGETKTLTIIHQPSGEWYVAITTEHEEAGTSGGKALTVVHNPVGVDSGLINYMYLSDGTHVDNPRFIKQHEKRIRKAQKNLSRKKLNKKTATTRTGKTITIRVPSKNRLKAKELFAKRWQEYTDTKEDWQWKQANTLARKHDFIAYENLPIPNMIKNHNLARAIQDASWAGFWNKVENVVAKTDSTRTQKVNPRYTTQRCCRCGHRIRLALSERTYRCPHCEYVAPRDGNASENIKQLGLFASGLRVEQPIGMDDPESTPVETEPLPPEAERPVIVASLVVEAGSKGSPHADRAPKGPASVHEGSPQLQSWEDVTMTSRIVSLLLTWSCRSNSKGAGYRLHGRKRTRTRTPNTWSASNPRGCPYKSQPASPRPKVAKKAYWSRGEHCS